VLCYEKNNYVNAKNSMITSLPDLASFVASITLPKDYPKSLLPLICHILPLTICVLM